MYIDEALRLNEEKERILTALNNYKDVGGQGNIDVSYNFKNKNSNFEKVLLEFDFEIKEIEKNIQEEIKEIEKVLENKLLTSNEKKCLRLRYINFFEFKEIMGLMAYSRTMVFKFHREGLKKLKIKKR